MVYAGQVERMLERPRMVRVGVGTGKCWLAGADDLYNICASGLGSISPSPNDSVAYQETRFGRRGQRPQ